MAGWRPSLSRQRRRPDPMLPAGMPSLALISAYGSAGSSMSRAGSCWQPGAAARTPDPGPRKFGREQVLLGRLSVVVGGMIPAAGAYPAPWDRGAVRRVRPHSRWVVVASQPGSAAGSRRLSRWPASLGQTFWAPAASSSWLPQVDQIGGGVPFHQRVPGQ